MNWDRLARLVVARLPCDDRVRWGAELLGLLDDAKQAGYSTGPVDVLSLLGFFVRRWARRVWSELPMVAAGIPIMLLVMVALGEIHAVYFNPWDVIEEVPSTTTAAIRTRALLGYSVVLHLPVIVLAGWRAAVRFRDGPRVLPAVFILGIVFLISQAGLFEESAADFGRGPRAADVDVVPVPGVAMYSLTFIIPLIFLLLDARLTRQSRTVEPG